MRTHVQEWTGPVPGYGAATPGGLFAIYVPGRLASSFGNLPLPGDPAEPAGFIDVMERDGDLLVVCAGQATDTAWLWTGFEWRALARPERGAGAFGTGAVLFNPARAEAWSCTFDEATKIVGVVKTKLSDFSHSAEPIDAGTQGFGFARADGTVMLGKDCYIDLSRGLCAFTDFGDVAIGQGVNDGLVVRFADDGIVRALESGIWRYPRVKRDGDQFAICAVAESRGFTTIWWPTLAELRALPPLAAGPIIVPPPPPPPPPPPETKMNLPADVCATLRSERAKFGALIESDAQLAAILCNTAWIHRAGGWGLSRKDFGTHIDSPAGKIAHDILHRRTDNLHWDVMNSAGVGFASSINCGEAIGPMTDSRRPWVAPVEPTDSIPTPTPTPPSGELAARVAVLEQAIAHSVALNIEQGQQIEALSARLDVVEVRKAPEFTLPELYVQGTTGRIDFRTGKYPIDLPVKVGPR